MAKPNSTSLLSAGRWMIILWTVGVLTANGRDGVDGFAPLGLPMTALGSAVNGCDLGLAFGLDTHPRTLDSQRRNLDGSRVTPSTRTKTKTQLGMFKSLVLPLPLPTLRLSGYALRIAESWAPAVGVLTSTLLYLAPIKAIYSAIRRARNSDDSSRDTLNGLNPLPIAIMPSVAISWLAYGFASSDPYLIMGNLPGTLLSMAYLIAILPLMSYNAAEFPTLPAIGNESKKSSKTKKNDQKIDSNESTRKSRTKPKKSKTLILTHATVLLSTAATLSVWAILGLMTAGATDGLFHVGGLEFGMGFSSMARNGVIGEALGVYAAVLFIILSASPLSMIRSVVKTKNSRSILGSLTAAQCVNTGLWTTYGFAVNDYFVWGPNIIGLGLGLMQLALKILYPSKSELAETTPTAQ